MASEKTDGDFEKISFESAIDRAGFGLYSIGMLCLSGAAIISFACVGYGSMIIVPTSACELETTSAQQGILAAGPVVGSMLGGILWGYLADTRGRRSMLLIALLGGSLFNLIASISVNWIMLMVFQFIASIFASGLYSMSVSLLSESVPVAKRNLGVLLVVSISLLAQGIMSVLAIPIIPLSFSYHITALDIYWNSWRTLMAVYSVPSVLTAIWLLFMQESPKFLYTKGDEDGALKILKVIHKVNHFWSKKEFQVAGLLKEDKPIKEGPASAKDQIVPLFKSPLLKYTVIMTSLIMLKQVGPFIVWLPRIADQFVRIVQTGETSNQTMCGIISSSLEAPIDPNATPCALDETSLLIVLGVGALQSIVNLLISTVVNKVGRRNIVLVLTSVCGVSGILVNLVPNVIGSATLFLVFLIGFVTLGLYTALMVSLFPTNVKVMALAFAMSCGRLATFASIQILNALLVSNCDAGFYLFACLFTSSFIVASFLPDDRRLSNQKPLEIATEKTEENNNSTPL